MVNLSHFLHCKSNLSLLVLYFHKCAAGEPSQVMHYANRAHLPWSDHPLCCAWLGALLRGAGSSLHIVWQRRSVPVPAATA